MGTLEGGAPVDGLSPSEADREAVVAILREQLAADRLSLESFERNVERVYASSTLDQVLELRRAFEIEAPGPPRRWPWVLAAAALSIALVGGAIAAATDQGGRALPTAAPGAPSDRADEPDAATRLLARARDEGWFRSCDASAGAMERAVPGSVHLDRLADAVPEETVELYSLGAESPLQMDSQVAEWIAAAVLEAEALEGYVATFNNGPPGPGGWSVIVYRFGTATAARQGLTHFHDAFVCIHGADPFPIERIPGALGATRHDTVQIYWTSDDVLVIVDWSVFQDRREAQQRAEAAADAVEAQLAGLS